MCRPITWQCFAQADAISWSAPHQTSKTVREKVNRQEVEFVGMHLSQVPQMIEFGIFRKIAAAVVEAIDMRAQRFQRRGFATSYRN